MLGPFVLLALGLLAFATLSGASLALRFLHLQELMADMVGPFRLSLDPGQNPPTQQAGV